MVVWCTLHLFTAVWANCRAKCLWGFSLTSWCCNQPTLQCSGELCTTQARLNTLVVCLGHMVTWWEVKGLLRGSLSCSVANSPPNCRWLHTMLTGLFHQNLALKPPTSLHLISDEPCLWVDWVALRPCSLTIWVLSGVFPVRFFSQIAGGIDPYNSPARGPGPPTCNV